MFYRIGEVQDFDRLEWSWGKYNDTKIKYMEAVQAGTQELWVCESEDGKLVGELQLVFDSPDPDQANGINRAYLCAFRVHPAYQGKGIGSRLMERVFERAIEKGCTELTIGVELDEEQLIKMYNHWGFIEAIKIKEIDHHDFTSEGGFKQVKPFTLYKKVV
ncbi:GNAT family N-acetyltransferase [Paenibacillus rhizovicinus]|uniref:GNAT family N-acetyltransferase n=1 Tax=Paenibacillus rhizovicinus TaxID=2704463 RepID=A0A6C0P3Z2_9BACL|nr:GNAT family N-acetyltransferase [Paenibacillus rhizovicinus]QHW33238.1 GNAT family N-acetyltransferase [Paenibacillus rhizovicinus]